MSKITLTDTLTIASLGVVAGSRAMLAPALVSQHLQARKDEHEKNSIPRPRITKAGIWTLLAAGELIGDKMPLAPNRIQPLGLIGRGISGGLAGASVGRQLHRKAWVGALIGSATALCATYALWYARTRLTKHTKLPDGIAGLAEDALMLYLGHRALARVQ